MKTKSTQKINASYISGKQLAPETYENLSKLKNKKIMDPIIWVQNAKRYFIEEGIYRWQRII